MRVRNVEVRAGETWLVPGDLHFDQQDQAAVEVMLKAAAGAGIAGCVLVGDTMNSAGVSRHGRPTRNFRLGRGTIKSEHRAAAPTLSALRDMVTARGGVGKLHVLEGNHERWWQGVQDEYPGLLDTPWFELYGDLFDGWHAHDELTSLKLGPLLICHGHRLRGALARQSAQTVLTRYPGQNTLYGHTHRLESATTPTWKYGVPTVHGAWTVGHLRDRTKEIECQVTGPDSERHEQGFALVTFFDRGVPSTPALGFDVQLVRIHRDTEDAPMVSVNGKEYR